MYRKALVRQSTAPLYVLFTLHNDKIGEDRVVCTVGPFLLGAIEMEYGKQAEKRLLEIALHQPGHRFTFKNPKALENIAFGDNPETLAEAREYLERMSDKQLRENIDNGTFDRWCQRVTSKQGLNCQAAIAHVLLERGMLVGHGDMVPKLYLER